MRDGQLGFGQEFAVRIGIDKSLQCEAALCISAGLQVRERAIIEYFVRFRRSVGYGLRGRFFSRFFRDESRRLFGGRLRRWSSFRWVLGCRSSNWRAL